MNALYSEKHEANSVGHRDRAHTGSLVANQNNLAQHRDMARTQPYKNKTGSTNPMIQHFNSGIPVNLPLPIPDRSVGTYTW